MIAKVDVADTKLPAFALFTMRIAKEISGLRSACALVLVGVGLVVTGCQTPAPVVQEVKVPVYRPCVTAVPARPTFATRALAPDASAGEKVLALARDLPLHLKYEAQLEAVIAGCL